MRKAGEPVHCTWIPAVRDLGEALEQLNPELLICAYVPEADVKQAATVRDQLAPQVPMLLVRPQISEGRHRRAACAWAPATSCRCRPPIACRR